MGIEKEKFSLHPNKHILPRQSFLPMGRRNSLTRRESDFLFHKSLQTIKWDASILWWAMCFIQSTNLNVMLFSHSVMSNSLRPHGLKHARLPCSSLSPRVCSDSGPLSRWCHPTIYLIFWCPLLLLTSIFHSISVFSNELALRVRWPKYWSFSFSISSSKEYSGLISFRIDWFDLIAVQRTFKCLL